MALGCASVQQEQGVWRAGTLEGLLLPQRQAAEVRGADRQEVCGGLAGHEAARTERVRAAELEFRCGLSLPALMLAVHSVGPGSGARFWVRRNSTGRLWGPDLPAEATQHCSCDGTSLSGPRFPHL